MKLEAKAPLEDTTISALQELIQVNLDSANGLREAARQISDETLAKALLALAETRSENASELQECVEWNGEDAEVEGSYVAALHQAWLKVRAALAGGNPQTVLAEVVRGEKSVVTAYESALRVAANSPVHEVLLAQFERVRLALEQYRSRLDS